MLPLIFHALRDCHFGPSIVNRLLSNAVIGPASLTRNDSRRKKGKAELVDLNHWTH